MTSFEALAVTALRRWCAERRILRNGTVPTLSATGYTERASRTYDARIVRVLSFEQAFSTLDTDEQTALLLVYRDGLSAAAAASALRLRVPVAQACVAGARLRLANTLDRYDLL